MDWMPFVGNLQAPARRAVVIDSIACALNTRLLSSSRGLVSRREAVLEEPMAQYVGARRVAVWKRLREFFAQRLRAGKARSGHSPTVETLRCCLRPSNDVPSCLVNFGKLLNAIITYTTAIYLKIFWDIVFCVLAYRFLDSAMSVSAICFG